MMVEKNAETLLKSIYKNDLTVKFKCSDVFNVDESDPFSRDFDIEVSFKHFKAMTFEIMKDFSDVHTSAIKRHEGEAEAFLMSFDNFHTWKLDGLEFDFQEASLSIKHGYYRLVVLYLQKLESEIKKK